MKNYPKIKQLNSKNVFLNLIYLLILLLMIFGRPFTGLYLFGFRLGELIIGLGFLASLVFLFLPRENSFFIETKLTNVHKLLIASFFLIALLSSSSFLNEYTYKVSSYIWTLSFLYASPLLFRKNENNLFFKLVKYVLPIIYFFNTFIFPNFIFNFFKKYADKFDYIKASDILLVFVVINFLNKKLITDEKKRFYSFVISFAFFAPLMSFMSRGSFVSLLVYGLFELFQQFDFIKKRFLQFLTGCLLGLGIFIFSAVNVTSDMLHIIDNIVDDITENLGLSIDINFNFNWLNFGDKNVDPFAPKEVTYEEIIQNLDKGVNRRNQNLFELLSFGSFSIEGGANGFRFYNVEPLANWRLQLWQDIIFDMNKKNLIISGYGYESKIPAMELEDNNGNDSTNENVHNYFVQVFARGGLIHLSLVILINVYIVFYWKKKYGNFKILQYMTPLLLVSCFDPSLETVRFPIIYYSFLGYFLNTGLQSIDKVRV
ncbi:MAG: hypothetical protein VW452_03300 [Pelagibacteraceae bacterium]